MIAVFLVYTGTTGNRGGENVPRRGRGSGRSLPAQVPGRGGESFGHSPPTQEQSSFEKEMSSQIFEVSNNFLVSSCMQ